MRQPQVIEKPIQPIKVLDDLLQYANYAKPLNDYIVENICKNFNKQSKDKLNFILVENKTKTRVLEKQNEADVCDCDRILDFVRCSVICPSLESLFDFVNYAKNYHIELSNDIMNGHSVNPNISDYLVNNFVLDQSSITTDHRNKYPFIDINTNVKKTEFMDFKLYLTIPIYALNDISTNYIFTEILCTLTGFRKYYEPTHKLYEVTRTESHEIFKHSDFAINKKDIIEYFKYKIYTIHRHNVINPYNQNSKGLKMCPTDYEKEKKLYKLEQTINPKMLSYINIFIDNLINQEDIRFNETLLNEELKVKGIVLSNVYSQNKR